MSLLSKGVKTKKQATNLLIVTKYKFWVLWICLNGDVKNELFTLSVENYRDFKDYLNKKISIAVGAMASGRNVIFYVAKGAKPVLAETM